MPALARMVDRAWQPAWRVLERLDGTYEIADGWCAAPALATARAGTKEWVLARTGNHGVVNLAELRQDQQSAHADQSQMPPSQSHMTESVRRAWLSYCGFVIEGDALLTSTDSAANHAAALLALAGEPLTVDQIVTRMHSQRRTHTVQSALAKDSRFQRVAKGCWALSEWGLQPYVGLRALIRDQIAAAGGQAPLAEVVSQISGRYGVKASSVATYARAAPFEVRDGIVRLAMGTPGVAKTPEETRRVYRRPHAWVYRMRVLSQHAHGSSILMPTSVGRILRLKQGESCERPCRGEAQGFGWTTRQPTARTIRRILADDGIAVGEEIFLVFADDGSFDIERVRHQGRSPLSDALALVGAPDEISRDSACATLAQAILLPSDSPVSTILDRYRARGDQDVVDLLSAEAM
jgi:hypothetical protein